MSRILLYQLGDTRIKTLEPDLAQRGYQVIIASGQWGWKEREWRQAAWEAAPWREVDVILVDASCGLDGTSCCRTLSLSYPGTPLILLAAKDAPPSQECKNLTGDNVLHLPFTTRKVINRVKKLIDCRQGEILQAGALALNLQTRCVCRGSAVYRLTPKQASLLEVFMRHPGQVLTRKFLMETVWDTDYLGDTRTLDVHVRWLRERIEEDPGTPQNLRTVRGVGYQFGVQEKDKA